MRLYVASKFENASAARDAMQQLTLAGHRITYDWTVAEVSADRSTENLTAIAMDEVDGVFAAEALVLLHHDGMKGAWVEVGAALARAIPVVVVGGRLECIFEHLCFSARSVGEAIELLARLQRDRA
jgi:hypothetical protein